MAQAKKSNKNQQRQCYHKKYTANSKHAPVTN